MSGDKRRWWPWRDLAVAFLVALGTLAVLFFIADAVR